MTALGEFTLTVLFQTWSFHSINEWSLLFLDDLGVCDEFNCLTEESSLEDDNNQKYPKKTRKQNSLKRLKNHSSDESSDEEVFYTKGNKCDIIYYIIVNTNTCKILMSTSTYAASDIINNTCMYSHWTHTRHNKDVLWDTLLLFRNVNILSRPAQMTPKSVYRCPNCLKIPPVHIFLLFHHLNLCTTTI